MGQIAGLLEREQVGAAQPHLAHPAGGDLGEAERATGGSARGYGLDTCPQESWARMYRIVGEFLSVPPDRMLFCAVAVGYGDRKHPANSFRSPRAALHDFCTFAGFEGN
jgi:hypothetical protein